MNYHAHYETLISRARNRRLTGYSEKHHIIPRCLGGMNCKSNIVRLTAEEHFVAHKLLCKMHPGNHRLLWAAVAMTNGTKRQCRTNKLYGWLRREFAKRMGEQSRGKKASAETRKKQSIARLGIKTQPHSEETKAKMRAASLGRKKSDSHRAALSAAKKGKKLPAFSAAHKEKLRKSNIIAAKSVDRAVFRSARYRELQREKALLAWQRRKLGESSLPSFPQSLQEV